MLTKEIKKALANERQELAKKKAVLAEEIAALDLKIQSIDGVVGLTVAEGKAKELGEAHRIQGPVIEVLRAHPFGMTPPDITKELLRRGLEESPTRKMISSVWQVLYRLKKDNRIKVKSGGVHVWIGGSPYTKPMKPGGVRERVTTALQEVAPEGLSRTDLVERLEADGVVVHGITELPTLITTVLGQMRRKSDVQNKMGRWHWIGGVVASTGGWNKMTADERSAEMKRRLNKPAAVLAEANGNGNGHRGGRVPEPGGLREKVLQTIREQPGITRSALRGIIEPLFKPSGKTSVRDKLWVDLAQSKKVGKIVEQNGKLYPAENAPAADPAPSPSLNGAGAGMLVHGIRSIMKTHPSGISRKILAQKLDAQGFKARGKYSFGKRLSNEISRMKTKKEVREAMGFLFLTGKLPPGARVPKPAAEEAAQA